MYELIKSFKKDKLNVNVYIDRKSLGKAAANAVAEKIKKLQKGQSEIRMILGSAPSQDEFFDELVKIEGIEWNKITAFHMDEYIGLNRNAEQLFSKYLVDRVFNKVPIKKAYLIEPFEDAEKEIKRYEELLREKPIDIVCLGIGENGHIAFNDPPAADFNDPYFVKIVTLDDISRKQQVNDGCFPQFKDVPKRAVTLTVPALLSGKYLSTVVPGTRKADAVAKTLTGEINTKCPASILRNHDNVILYIDKDSASKIEIS
jgi:glucosamine-6-phosphate deaminase